MPQTNHAVSFVRHNKQRSAMGSRIRTFGGDGCDDRSGALDWNPLDILVPLGHTCYKMIISNYSILHMF